MMPTFSPQPQELEAFGATCPDPREVDTFMQEHGFTLSFHLTAQPGYGHNVPDLPAQYHYEDRYGTQVVYLAGQDHEMDGLVLPPHASRWWLTEGSNHLVYMTVQDACTQRWFLLWCPLDACVYAQSA